MAPTWTLQANRDRLEEIKEQLPVLRAAEELAIAHAASGEHDAVVKSGNEFADRATPATEAIKKTLAGMADSFASLLARTKGDSHADNRSLNLTMALTTVAGLGIGIFLAIYLIRNITAAANREKLASAEFASQIAAIGKSQGMIEFNMDGTVVTANDNLLNILGYRLEEIQGKHHSMFVSEAHRQSAEYSEFWEKLKRGEHHAVEGMRIGKGGNPVWFRASYNPILDGNGKPFKVVEYVTDVTLEVKARQEMVRIQSMVENSPSNIMYADRDLNIQYINPASAKTLLTLEKYLPVKASQIIGQSIDIFHKDPSHQRRMLANDKNLPHRAQIALGPEALDLSVCAIYDKDKNYTGSMLTWEVITERVAKDKKSREAAEREV